MVKIRIITAILACFMLSACMPKVATKEVIVEKDIPIYVIPKPPLIQSRPILEISKLSDEDKKNINKVAAALTITVEQLRSYSTDLEAVYNKYMELSNTPVLITELNKKTSLIDELKQLVEKQHPMEK